MDHFNDFRADEFAAFAPADNPMDWAIGSDELGNPLFADAILCDQLRSDYI